MIRTTAESQCESYAFVLPVDRYGVYFFKEEKDRLVLDKTKDPRLI